MIQWRVSSASLYDVAVLVVGCVVIAALLQWFIKTPLSRIKLPYPPGPPPKNWIAGNIGDVPLEEQWIPFTEWAKTYGNIVHFRILHQHNIVINSLEVAIELLEKRSNNYSNRPYIPMTELMLWTSNTTFKFYGDSWRYQRRLFQQHFKPEVVQKYQEIQTRKIHDMLYHLLIDPDGFYSHIRHASGAIIISALYGHDTTPKDDHFVEIAEQTMNRLTIAMLPGAFLVNTISALKYLPSWFPGTEFKRFAQESTEWTQKMLNEPIEMVKKHMESGESQPCIAAELLESCRSEGELEEIKGVCSAAYAGGADTSVSCVQTFFYAMANNPLVQQKAQDEIDRLTGGHRLPTFEDRPALPYVEALLRETLRWRPILPLAVAHAASEEDIFGGYHIPKGAPVMANIWGMTRDPTKYENPEDFDPSRFFDKAGALNDDQIAYVFGFGRRLCPGRHLGLATVWLSIVTVLATFNIRKKKDAKGREIPVDSEYNKSMLIHPLPFECTVVPRSEGAKALIFDVMSQYNL